MCAKGVCVARMSDGGEAYEDDFEETAGSEGTAEEPQPQENEGAAEGEDGAAMTSASVDAEGNDSGERRGEEGEGEAEAAEEEPEVADQEEESKEDGDDDVAEVAVTPRPQSAEPVSEARRRGRGVDNSVQFAWLGKDSHGERIATGHLRLPTGYQHFLDAHPHGPRRVRSAPRRPASGTVRREMMEDTAWRDAVAKLDQSQRDRRLGNTDFAKYDAERKKMMRVQSARLAARPSLLSAYVNEDTAFQEAKAKLEANRKKVARKLRSGRKKTMDGTFHFLSSLAERCEKRLAWIQKESHEFRVKDFARKMIDRLSKETRERIFRRYYDFINGMCKMCVAFADVGSMAVAIFLNALMLQHYFTLEEANDLIDRLLSTQNGSSDNIVVNWLLVVLGELATYARDDSNGYHTEADIMGNLIRARSVSKPGTTPRVTTKTGKEHRVKSFKDLMVALMQQQQNQLEREARSEVGESMESTAAEGTASSPRPGSAIGSRGSVHSARAKNAKMATLVRMTKVFAKVHLLLDGANAMYAEIAQTSATGGTPTPTDATAREGEVVVSLSDAIGPNAQVDVTA